MRYFLDAEFNGFQGQLISLALVPEADHAVAFYAALHCEAPTNWVRDHVLPVLQIDAVTRTDITARLADYFKGDPEPIVVADWPEDIAYFALLLITGPGSRLPMQTVRFELLNLPLFDSPSLSQTPHNALCDASALKAYVTADQGATNFRRRASMTAG